MSGLREMKFEMFIKDISAKIERNISKDVVASFAMACKSAVFASSLNRKDINNTSLLIIYDYDKLNELAKIIVSKSTIFIADIQDEYENGWLKKYGDINQFTNDKEKMIAATDLINMCQKEKNRDAAYKFIFWSLMVLTVDKTDVEEHLSLICDFAKILSISKEELEDIVYLIKHVYDSTETEYVFKSTTICRAFAPLLQ